MLEVLSKMLIDVEGALIKDEGGDMGDGNDVKHRGRYSSLEYWV